MKIAIAHGWGWQVGGVEGYLRELIPELLRNGHEVAFGYERASFSDQIYWPDSIPSFDLSLGGTKGLDGFIEWGADINYLHIVQDVNIWKRILCSGPCIYFAHSYMMTCVSGRKCHRFPRMEVCQKQFGWSCLMHYFPRGCGGKNPWTMLRDFYKNASLLKSLRRCRLVITHSKHMQEEMGRHVGLEKVRVIPFCLPEATPAPDVAEVGGVIANSILFLGRIESEKGADYLLRSIPFILPDIRDSLRVVMAGTGSMMNYCKMLASQMQERFPMVSFEFPGWLEGDAKIKALQQASVFAMPSIWPEPLGMAPLEAMSMGVPVAGFNRGGFCEYVKNGENGYLAPEPVSPEGLAKAINACLLNRDVQKRLGLCAMETSKQFSVRSHVLQLTQLFHGVLIQNKTSPQST